MIDKEHGEKMNYGLYCYREGREIAGKDHGFYALIQAAMRKADDLNLRKLRTAWPELYDELKVRYNAPGGILPGEEKEMRENLSDKNLDKTGQG